MKVHDSLFAAEMKTDFLEQRQNCQRWAKSMESLVI
jgi:hypothetical protein